MVRHIAGEERGGWASLEGQWHALLENLSKAEDEEEVGLYLLVLHLNNKPDLDFFSAAEAARIRKLLGFLIEDTARHRDLLSLVILELREKRRGHHAA